MLDSFVWPCLRHLTYPMGESNDYHQRSWWGACRLNWCCGEKNLKRCFGVRLVKLGHYPISCCLRGDGDGDHDCLTMTFGQIAVCFVNIAVQKTMVIIRATCAI